MDDPEIRAMATIGTALEALDDGAKERVLRWARDRYGKPATHRETPSGFTMSSVQRGTSLPRMQGDNPYTDVADVYAAANPSSEADKVLVVGYWFQVVRGETELDSQSLNMELKNLGYPLGNVTRAVTSLTRSVPRYLVQTKKSGSTKQARKKFRLTVEGIKRVEQMLGGATPLPLQRVEDEMSSDDSDT